jgi:hypothetical protein
MSDPTTYTFYGTTVPVLRSINNSAISILTTAQTELANGLPISEQEILDAAIGDMLPFRMQPILLAKFQTAPIEHLKLHNATSAPIPALNPGFTSLADVIDFFKALNAVYDAIDSKAWNDAAEKAFDLRMESMGKTLKISGLADFWHGFVLPNSYFHLNAMYMLLRGKGFKLGKSVYVGAWMSETLRADFAPLRG